MQNFDNFLDNYLECNRYKYRTTCEENDQSNESSFNEKRLDPFRYTFQYNKRNSMHKCSLKHWKVANFAVGKKLTNFVIFPTTRLVISIFFFIWFPYSYALILIFDFHFEVIRWYRPYTQVPCQYFLIVW